MPTPANVPLSVQRNEDFGPLLLQWCDAAGAALDITGWSFALRINTASGLSGAPELSLGPLATGNGSYVKIDETGNGTILIFIAKEDIAALSGSIRDVVPKAYNLIATDQFGVERVLSAAVFTINPGV